MGGLWIGIMHGVVTKDGAPQHDGKEMPSRHLQLRSPVSARSSDEVYHDTLDSCVGLYLSFDFLTCFTRTRHVEQ